MKILYISQEGLHTDCDIICEPEYTKNFPERQFEAVVSLKDYNKLLQDVETVLYAQLGGHITANTDGKACLDRLRKYLK